jgi:diguanylate cyclase (GGDEF)-like protein
MAGGTRLSVGWYIGRFDALVSSCVLLFGYLREINRVYLRTVAHAQELAASNEVLGTQVVESRLQLDKARYDHLTRLPSRALFLDRAEALRARSALDGSSVAVLFIDLDGFKRVNDTLGHDRGDAVLVEAADALRSVVREKDIAGRMGGDEFAVFLVAPKSAIETLATSIAHRIVAAIGRIGDGIGCSIGVALCPAGCGDLTCALRQADEAMYSAKRAGKNRYAVYGPVDETIAP